MWTLLTTRVLSHTMLCERYWQQGYYPIPCCVNVIDNKGIIPYLVVWTLLTTRVLSHTLLCERYWQQGYYPIPCCVNVTDNKGIIPYLVVWTLLTTRVLSHTMLCERYWQQGYYPIPCCVNVIDNKGIIPYHVVRTLLTTRVLSLGKLYFFSLIFNNSDMREEDMLLTALYISVVSTWRFLWWTIAHFSSSTLEDDSIYAIVIWPTMGHPYKLAITKFGADECVHNN